MPSKEPARSSPLVCEYQREAKAIDHDINRRLVRVRVAELQLKTGKGEGGQETGLLKQLLAEAVETDDLYQNASAIFGVATVFDALSF